MSDYRIRPATADDSEALYALHRAAMGPYVEQVYGPWDDDVQRGFHDRWFAEHDVQVIEIDGAVAGVLSIEERSGGRYLSRIALHPDHQRRGLGSRIITALVQQADVDAEVLELDVFTVNPARGLYERLGFEVIGHDGPKLQMRRPPRHDE